VIDRQNSGRVGRQQRTVIVALWGILAANLALPMYGSAAMNPAMAADLAMDRTMLGLAFTTFAMFSGLPTPLVALLVNRVGVRFVLVIGSLVVAVGAICMAFLVVSGQQAVLVFGVVIGLGVAMAGPLPAQVAVTQWFSERRALALAFVLSAGSIAGFLAVPALERLTASSGGDWRVGWRAIAITSCAAAVIAAICIRAPPILAEKSQHHELGGSSSGATVSEALRTPTFWIMLATGVVVTAGYTMVLAHGVVHLSDQGFSSSTAARAISAMLLCSLIGKFAIGFLGGRLDTKLLWAIAMLIFAAGVTLLATVHDPRLLFAGSAAVGIGFGGMLVGMMTLLVEYFGKRSYPSLVGVAYATQTGIGAFAPVIAGGLRDRLGNYDLSFFSIAALAIVGAVLLFNAKRPRLVARDRV
jgi:MFS family permease